jgi:hypothetical protein
VVCLHRGALDPVRVGLSFSRQGTFLIWGQWPSFETLSFEKVRQARLKKLAHLHVEVKVDVLSGNQTYLISQLESHLNFHSRLSVLVTYIVLHTFRKLQRVVNVLRILMVSIHLKDSLNLCVETFVAFVISVGYGIGTFSACLYLSIINLISDTLFRKSLDRIPNKVLFTEMTLP